MTSPAVRGSPPGPNSGSDPDSGPVAGEASDPAHALERALADVGIACDVEGQGKLALLLATDDAMARLADDAMRRQAVDLARAIGFSHVAIELRAAPAELGPGGGVLESDAPLPRD
jgi:hypothetical protein